MPSASPRASRPFRHLRQLGLLVEAALLHRRAASSAVPADLLDAVIELVGVAFGIGRIGVPVRARHVAADAAGIDASHEIVDAVADLAQGADLPGDLVGRDLGRNLRSARWSMTALWEQHEGVMVGAVAHEIADGSPTSCIFRHPRRREKSSVSEAKPSRSR